MDNQDQLIEQFIEISGGDENVARFYLSSSNWSLEDALSNFLGNQTDDVNSQGTASMEGGSKPLAGPSGSSNNSNSTESFGNNTLTKPKFATLNDMDQHASDDEEGQAFYAGGSERSGQQVLGPPKKKNFREQLTDMFRMAQEQSSVETPPMPSTSSGINWGTGLRLGTTNDDHGIVKTSTSSSGQEKKPVVILKLWSQGFSINDGELRLYDDPENKEFLETVMRGEIPTELLEMGWMVNVDVEDHRHEDYKKKPQSVKTFRGSGHTLGSPAPKIENILPKTSSNNKEHEKEANEKLNVNTAEPTTSIQIRLADGSRLAAQFNVSHTVGDIRQYIQSARPQYENQNYVLVSSFPTVELTDISMTIEKAGLKNAALMQRLK